MIYLLNKNLGQFTKFIKNHFDNTMSWFVASLILKTATELQIMKTFVVSILINTRSELYNIAYLQITQLHRKIEDREWDIVKFETEVL